MKVRIGLAIVLAISIGAGSIQLKVTDDASAAMLPQDPSWQKQYASFLDQYPGDQTASVLLRNLVCTESGWQLLVELHTVLSSATFSKRVLSLASPESKLVQNDGDQIAFDRVSETEFATSQDRCEALLNSAPYRNRLINAEDHSTYILVFTHSTIDAVTVSEQLSELIQPFRKQAAEMGGQVIVTGEPIMSAEIARLIQVDSGLIAITFLVMLALVFFFTRSPKTVAIVLSLNAFVLTTTYGTMGWMGITLTPATSLVVFLLIPLSTAFVIHAVGYVSRTAQDNNKETRQGFAIAALSTGIGFAATGFTPASDIQLMALMGVVGICATTVGVFLFVLPLLSSKRAVVFRIRTSQITRLLAHPSIGYAFLVLMILYTGLGVSKLEFNYGPVSNLPKTNEVRLEYESASISFPKMSIPLVIELERLNDAHAWQKLTKLESNLASMYKGKLTVQWLGPHIAELAKAFTPEETKQGGFPSNDEEIAQFLLLFSPDDMSFYSDDSESSIVLYLNIPFDTSKEYLELKNYVYQFLEQNELNGVFAGRVSAFFEAGHRVGIDTLRGLFVSSLAILALLWFLYRSAPLALAGTAVNVIPVGAGLATLGLMGVPVEIGSAVVAAIAFGILLDDSMHLLVRVRNRVKAGYDPSTAVNSALGDLLTPIVASTITISVGYSVLFFANLHSFNDFALVISSTLCLALLSDILVLPLLVRRFFRDPLA